MESGDSILSALAHITEADLRSRYRDLSRKNHPDKNPDVPDSVFQEISESYEILCSVLVNGSRSIEEIGQMAKALFVFGYEDESEELANILNFSFVGDEYEYESASRVRDFVSDLREKIGDLIDDPWFEISWWFEDRIKEPLDDAWMDFTIWCEDLPFEISYQTSRFRDWMMSFLR